MMGRRPPCLRSSGLIKMGRHRVPGREIRLDRPCRVHLPQGLGHEGPAAIVPKAELIRRGREVVGPEVCVRELAEALSADQTHDVLLVDGPPRIEPLRQDHHAVLYRHAALSQRRPALREHRRDCRFHGFHAVPVARAGPGVFVLDRRGVSDLEQWSRTWLDSGHQWFDSRFDSVDCPRTLTG